MVMYENHGKILKQMRKSYKFILIAILLIVTGFVMDEIYTFVPFSTNPQVAEKIIQPNSAYLFQINSQGETKMSGLFSSVPKESPISMKILNPDGSIIWEEKSRPIPYDPNMDKQSLVPSFFNSNPKGSLDVIITNLGEQQVIVNGGIHDFIEFDPNVTDFDATMSVYAEIILYGIFSSLLKIIGIIIGIIGLILFYNELKNLKKINQD